MTLWQQRPCTLAGEGLGMKACGSGASKGNRSVEERNLRARIAAESLRYHGAQVVLCDNSHLLCE